MSATRLIFIGPPGSGKGTQAQRLHESRGLTQLSSGHVLRGEICSQTELGQRVAAYVESGALVPDQVITDVMLSAVDKLPAESGFILDGFPRTVPQAEALGAGFADRGMTVDAVVDFDLPDETIIQRISGRRVCTKCGATYNVEFLPPKAEGVCDVCGAEVVQRKDDAPDVVRARLETYREQTEPLVAFYADRGLLCRIDASQPADEVEAAVLEAVDRVKDR
jgi:adenylate kinase